MKAFVKFGSEPYEAELRELPMPEPGDGEVLLKVSAAGICGSDLHAYRASPEYRWVRPPVILGHEFSGTVVGLGPGADRFRSGDRVVVIGIQGCGQCRVCRDGRTHLCEGRRVIGLDMNGGMAEWAVVNQNHLIAIPDGLDLATAALIEPFSVAVHGLSKVDILPEQTVVVSGPGPIGLLAAAIARLRGARVAVIGTGTDSDVRLPAAGKMGMATVNLDRESLDSALRTIFGGRPVDLWVEASGSSGAFKAAVGLIRRGGSMVVIGMYAHEFAWIPTPSVRAEHSLFFSYASADRDYRFALDVMAGGILDLEPLVSHFPLDRAGEAFRAAEVGAVVKAVLLPDKETVRQQ
ncbi:MAG: alcohol dehydrogenase catalytic domain-containing protein [Proteobacteria bacterium]|nr:alcohol dehydrogenase catalytic domain-containing protein [Pseudomonadota bacterium]